MVARPARRLRQPSVDPDPADRKLPGWPWYEEGDIVRAAASAAPARRRSRLTVAKITFRLVPYQDVMARVTSSRRCDERAAR